MSHIQLDEQDREERRKALSNGAVFGFIAARWLRRPWRLAAIVALMLGGTLCDLGIPWAAGGLVEAVSNPGHRAQAAWRAWGMLSALYMGMYLLRNRAFLAMNGFSARNMEEMVNASF